MRTLLLLAALAGPVAAAPAPFLEDKLREIERAGRLADPAATVPDHPPLYALVEPAADGYRFTRFSLRPVRGGGWVQLYTGQRLWEVKYQQCLRHPVGGDCEKPVPNAFARVNGHPVLNVFTAAITVGVRPLLFGVDTTYSFDHRKWDAALDSARARHAAEQGHPLQADLDRLRTHWDLLMTLEQRGADALRQRELAIEADGAPSALVAAAANGLAAAEFAYPWRAQLPAAPVATLGELVDALDALARRHAADQPRDWPLQTRCPAARLAAYVSADRCELTTSWQGERLRIGGRVSVRGFALPRQFPTALSLAGPGFEAEYRHGLVWMRNTGTRPLLVDKVVLLQGGREVPRWLKGREIKPGADAVFPGFVGELPELRTASTSVLLDPVRLRTTTWHGLRIHVLDAASYEPAVHEVRAESSLEELLATILRTEAAQPEPLDYEALKRVARMAGAP